MKEVICEYHAFKIFQGKRRRAQADFPGAEIILRQIKEKAKRKRVGLVSKGPPARGKIFVRKFYVISF